MFRPLLIAALIASPLPAFAQTQAAAADQQAETGQPPKRVRSVTLTGDQKCPQSTADEVVVCGRDDEPFRIPKGLRDDQPIAAQNQSWVNRAAVADRVGRTAAGLPDTCSPVGSGGQTGCALTWNRDFAAQRRADAAAERAVPGGEE